jgi:CRP/FNR family transcriptional regulator, cyclic AMP receptor protein
MDKIIQHFAKGEVIIAEGTEGDRLFKVLSGEVVICKQNLMQKMIPIARLGEGKIFGEMFLFDSGGLRSASVLASRNMKVEVLFENRILSELQEGPEELGIILSALSKRLQYVSTNLVNLFQLRSIQKRPDGSLYLPDVIE